MNVTKRLSWGWFLGRAMELSVALIVFYVAVTLYEYREALKRAEVPAEEWFTLNEIYVPDHERGSDPEMIYDRDIYVSHRGFWVAEVQRVNPDGREGVFQNFCTGSGVADYDVSDVLGADNTVTWSWFFGRPCAVPPGKYRIQLTRDMTLPDWPVKRTRSHSNIFEVK